MSPDEITSLAVAVGRLEQKVDDRDNKLDAIHRDLKDDIAGVEHRVTKRLDTVDGKVTETNGRVKKGEIRLAQLKGAGLVFAGASPFLVAFLAAWLSHVFG